MGLVVGQSAWAIEIRSARWGFDGRVQPERFNLLTVEVSNPTNAPFEGNLELQAGNSLEGSGVPLVQPIFLGPRSARLVQFSPFVTESERWKLTWGSSPLDRKSYDLEEEQRLSGPARVFLLDPENPGQAGIRLSAFPADQFPTTVSSTDGLQAVVLDHAPRFAPAQRAAWLDWLRRGGTVHVLHDSKGQFPVFGDELALLNDTKAESQQVGSGRVFWHAVGRKEVDGPFLDGHGSPARELKQGGNISIYSFDSELLQNLAKITQPEIAWWLIYLLTATYLVIIGPGQYFMTRKLSSLWMLLSLLGFVALYAWCFAWAGRRGADESQRVHSVAIAHGLGGNRYDVTQWSSAFVIRGDVYKFTHASAANLYASGLAFESKVSGGIENTRPGAFVVDVPRYSSRPFIHRAVMNGDPTGVVVESWKRDSAGKLSELRLKPAAGFPSSVRDLWVRDGATIYQMAAAQAEGKPAAKEGEGSWKLGQGFSQGDFFQNISEIFSMRDMNPYAREEAVDKSRWMRDFGRMLMARDLGGVDRLKHFTPARPLGPNEVELFVYAQAPESFRLQGNFSSETGWVLYVQKVPLTL